MVQNKIRELKSKYKLNSLTEEDRPEFTTITGESSIELTDDGTLIGRAVSHFKEGNSKLAGTTIQIFQKW